MKPWLTHDELTRTPVAADDLPHPIGAELDWREHWWMSFFDHTSNVHGKIWMGAVPNRKTGFAYCSLFIGDQQLFFFHDPEVDTTNYVPATVGPITFQCISPFREWAVRFSSGEASVELEWEAIAPVYDWSWGEASNSRRIEQPGRVRGQIRYKGEVIKVDGVAQRDRSWGLRRQGVEILEAATSWTLFSERDVQAAAIIRTLSKTFLFGYRIQDGDCQLIDSLEIVRLRAYPGGPPLTAQFRGTGGGRELINATTRLAAVLDQKTLVETDGIRRRDVRFSRQHCHWQQDGRTTTGHFDYNEVDNNVALARLTTDGNDGMFISA